MRVKQKLPYFVVAALLIIYLIFLVAVSLSHHSGLSAPLSAITGKKTIAFASGSFPSDTENLTVVLESGETSLLDGFEDLQSADFSGSSCLDEILSWSAAHPFVNVTYSVTLPNGETVNNSASSLNLSGIGHDSFPQTLSLLAYLPNISAIDLGTSSQSASPITVEDLSDLRAALPNVTVAYSVSIGGKDYSINDTSADLSGLTSAQIPDAVSSLAMLSNLTDITVGESATLNGELTWDDLSSLAEAFPNASIHYEFELCGQKATLSDTSLDLTGMNSSDLATVCSVLPSMTQLTSIDLGNESSGLTLDQISELYAAAPNASLNYSFTAFDRTINLSDETLDLNHYQMTDEGAEVRKLIPYMRNLKTLDMDSCGVSNEAMATIRDENPTVEVIWRVNFGDSYSVRTNVVKILASKPSKGGTITDSNAQVLKYCTKVRYLDLGHNDELSDFSFVEYMPDLEIAVISMAAISDLTPFSSCKNLVYLEAGNTNISDLTPLSLCPTLKHLNVGTCSGVSDISPLYDLDMYRLWLGVGDPVPAEQVEKMRSLHPDCEVNTTVPTGNETDAYGNITNEGYVTEGWKMYHQYMKDDWDYYDLYGVFPAQKPKGYFEAVYNAFGYANGEASYAFYWNDPCYEAHDSSVEHVNETIVDTSILYTHYVEEPDL